MTAFIFDYCAWIYFKTSMFYMHCWDWVKHQPLSVYSCQDNDYELIDCGFEVFYRKLTMFSFCQITCLCFFFRTFEYTFSVWYFRFLYLGETFSLV